MDKQYLKTDQGHILYDATALDHADDALFDPEHWRGGAAVEGSARGRATAWLITPRSGPAMVLRHYRRGGLPARLFRDCYLWSGLARSRPAREFALLARLTGLGLPVPAPLAVRVARTGLCYRGDILMGRMPGRPLSELLAAGPLPEAVWQAVGAIIARFHDAGVFHADLNAHNILVDGEAVYLIDFDRGALRRPGRWRAANLARLRRSLDKLAGQLPGFSFNEPAWQALMTAYKEGEK